MYQDYFGIAESPFSLTPDPRYLYMAEGHQEALAHLLYGVSAHGGFVLLTGEVGTGKTSVCRCLLEQSPAEVEVALILNPRLNERELLASICHELTIQCSSKSSLKIMVDRLNEHLLQLHADGRHAVLIIDEAQNLSPAVLEQVRLLTNLETNKRKLLQIILIGQPELDEILNRNELRQLAQRITSRAHLQPLNAQETIAYITHRLHVAGLGIDTFSRGAYAEVYKHARGIPRLINSLCDRCLLAAYAQDTKQIDRKIVRSAASEVFGHKMKPGAFDRPLYRWALAAVVVVAMAAATLLEVPRFWSLIGTSDATTPGETRPPSRIPADKSAESIVDPPAISESQSLDLSDPLSATPPLMTNDSTAAVASEVVGSEIAPPTDEFPLPPVADDTSGKSQQAKISQQPEPALTMNLGQLFAQNEVRGDRETALARLFGLWRRDYESLPGQETCDKARFSGLRCLTIKQSLPSLVALNRPALLSLKSPNEGRYHAILTGHDYAGLTLEVGVLRVRATIDDIMASWDGDYLMLWQPPAVYHRIMREGDKGPDVAWLKNQLEELVGDQRDDVAEATFDAVLKARVIAFQRFRSLSVDGVVGPQTLIHLNNMNGTADGVVLTAKN